MQGSIKRWTRNIFLIALPWFSGCLSASPDLASNKKTPFWKDETEKSPIVQAGNSEPVATPNVDPNDPIVQADALFEQKAYSEALKKYEAVAEDTRNRPEIAEKARYFQGECLRLDGYLPDAAATYHRLLQDFPSGIYRTQAIGRMFQIADVWLDDTRQELLPEEERKPKSVYDRIVPVNFERNKPFVNTEGEALKTLENAYFGDPTGPYADKALFMLGRVNFLRGRYKESAQFFQQLVETHDKSPLRDQALEMAIVARSNTSQGATYDSEDVQEAMRLITTARNTSPEMNRTRGEFLDKQALMVRYQQAEKDFQMGEFYRRSGHPGAAWWYYELVQRTYPGIKPFSDLAVERQAELKKEVEDMKNPSLLGRSRRFWKEYVLGETIPSLDRTTVPELKHLEASPESQQPATPTPSQVVPKEILPR
ncbi:MAG: tetratricopeptide repeat protein [Zavarzinella sp.]